MHLLSIHHSVISLYFICCAIKNPPQLFFQKYWYCKSIYFQDSKCLRKEGPFRYSISTFLWVFLRENQAVLKLRLDITNTFFNSG